MIVYHYIGPEEIRREAEGQAEGAVIGTASELRRWLASAPDALVEGATFVIDRVGRLRLASRRSEHVACAGGESVLAAGEAHFVLSGERVKVVSISNQSTGYCPEPECWPAVATALLAIGVAPPNGFTQTFVFRRCQQCEQINLVKDDWFVCANCDEALPRSWNFSR